MYNKLCIIISIEGGVVLTPLICYLIGNSDMLRKLNEIREIQEKLTLRHFEIDQMRIRHDRF